MELQDRLAGYLSDRIGTDVRVSGFARKSGGASRETYLFDAAWSDGGTAVERGYVLRRDPVASVLESDRTLEVKVLQAAHALGLPTPEVCWQELTGDALERPFCILERLPGMPTPPTFPAAYPTEMRARTAADF